MKSILPFSGQNSADSLTGGFTDGAAGFGTDAQGGTNPGVLNPVGSATTLHTTLVRVCPLVSRSLGDGAGNHFNEMAFSIEKVTVTAKSRALKARVLLRTRTRPQGDPRSECESELANILSTEILAEINREVIRTVYKVAEQGATANVANAGTFDLDVDSNGRWSVEKFKGLLFQIGRDANAIAQRTRRGKGNTIICSADVASALTMGGVLDYTPALNANLNVDDTGNTFAGVLQGKYRVYIDPYSANVDSNQYYVVGYKGSSAYDAGIFYCPYVPLQMVRAVGQDTFQPQDWSQDPLRYRCEPIRRRNRPQVSEDSLQTRTVTTDVSRLQTSCDLFHIFLGDPSGPLFMQINKNKTLCHLMRLRNKFQIEISCTNWI